MRDRLKEILLKIAQGQSISPADIQYLEGLDLLHDLKRAEGVAAGHAGRRDNPHQVSGADIDHGETTGLSDDDHTQYLLIDGSRAMSGDLDMGSNAISNVGNIAGGIVFNEGGADVDFRVEGDTNPNMIFVDAGNDKIGFGKSPNWFFDVEMSGSRADFTTFRAGGVQKLINNATNADGIEIWLGDGTNDLTTNNDFALFYDRKASNLEGSIDSNGSGGVRYNTTSDERLKKNIKDYKGALDKLSRIKVREYEMIDYPGKKQTGVIAQELFDVFPDAVTEPKIKKHPAKDKDGNDIEVEKETNWMVDYSKLVPLLVGAIQEQQEQINELRTEVEKLKK